MNLTPEEREVGRANYFEAVGAREEMTRRGFLRDVVALGAVGGVGLGALYFNYDKPANPVRIGVIGTGDEGNVLLGACNPDYVEVVAISDIRPSSIYRAFHGDWASPAALAARPGLMKVYGWNSEDEARKHVAVYERYQDLLAHKDLEAVIIGLPLHLHAPVAAAAMKKGLHVLTEKLMAHNVAQCKAISQISYQQEVLLATGHQRHYNVLYENAKNLLKWGLLGQVHYIQAQWHRGNLPGRDSWAQPIPGGEKIWGSDKVIDDIAKELKSFENALKNETDPAAAELLRKKIEQWTAWDRDKTVKAEEFGYVDDKYPSGAPRSAMEELVRWRIWERTGGGLMAELGSHQLDAASLFVSALHSAETGEETHVHPLTVHAVGGRHIFPNDRDADDHVYCTFEFPGPHYDPAIDVGYKDPVTNFPPKEGIQSYEDNPNRKIVYTYSTVNGNGWGGYGETVMGTKGTLVLDKEKEVMLYKTSDTATKIGVKAGAGGPTMDTQASGGPPAAVAQAAQPEDVSRGYREEIEHWAWCIRNRSPENRPRCYPEVATADAVAALTAKYAVSQGQKGKGGFIQFKPEWFDINSPETPDGSSVDAELSNFKNA